MTGDGFGEWPGADEVARIGGPVRPVVTDGGSFDRITLPVLVDVPREVYDRVIINARETLRHPEGPDDAELVCHDALSEYIEMDPVVVDDKVRDVLEMTWRPRIDDSRAPERRRRGGPRGPGRDDRSHHDRGPARRLRTPHSPFPVVTVVVSLSHQYTYRHI